jgi:hypothetical protein
MQPLSPFLGLFEEVHRAGVMRQGFDGKTHDNMAGEEREKHLQLRWRLHGALETKTEIVKEVVAKTSGQFSAFKKLAPLAFGAMEELVNDGTTPNKCDGRKKFWALVYGVILRRWTKLITADPDFRHVQIMEFLTRVLPIRLAEFAEAARERGNPILAQVMEELAGDVGR